MKRREFFKKTIGAGVFAGISASMLNFRDVLASSNDKNNAPVDLVAVKGGTPVQMFDAAIKEMGGIQTFVKKNQIVVIKPNIGWDLPPERAANTDPTLVGRIVEHCIQAGAKKVYVFDNTVNEWTRCYKNSGIEDAVKKAGGIMVSGKDEKYYQEIEIKNGKSLKNAKVHELILQADVFINVPILKTHGGTGLSLSMKNLMGVVWDRGYWHRNNLHQCIADFVTFKKPHLNIVDAYRVLARNGPRGVSEADVVEMKYLIISPDIVAADAAATKIFGWEIDKVPHISIAEKMGVGTADLQKLNIKRITL